MRVVAHPGLRQQFRVASQRLVPLLEHERVLVVGNDVVGVAEATDYLARIGPGLDDTKIAFADVREPVSV
jgi:hypothetical protein